MNSYLTPRSAAWLAAFVLIASTIKPAHGAAILNTDVTTPGDPVIGISGGYTDYFGISTPSGVGSNGNANVYPSNQPPAAALDNNSATKFANYARTSVGFITTLASNGPAVVRGIRFQTADDFPERDPLSVVLHGANVASPNAALSNVVWTPIYSGVSGLGVDPGRQAFGATITFTNNAAFNTYRLLSSGIRVGTATNVQIGEVELIGFTTNVSPGEITVPAVGPLTTVAGSYPSQQLVAERNGVIDQVTVTLSNVTHSRLEDLDILLVSPTGQAVKLLSDAGGAGGVANVTLTFADSAEAFVPGGGPVASGAFKPTDTNPAGDPDIFPAPAVFTDLQTTLASLAGLKPNGVWSLYVADDNGGSDGGSIEGWSITITTTNAPALAIAAVNASPYPSVKFVSGFTGLISRVTLTLEQITQNQLGALDVLLVSPSGQAVRVLSDVGGSANVTNLTLVLDDTAQRFLPPVPPVFSGPFKPTEISSEEDIFPAPAPGGPYTNNLSGFAALDPNGPWSLYVVRDTVFGDGQIADWNLTFVTTNAAPANDRCLGAIELTNGVPFSMSTATATSTGDIVPACTSQSGNGVWFTFTPPVDGLLRFNTCMSSYDTIVQVSTGSCAGLVAVTNGCNDNNGPLCGGPNASVAVSATAGVTYWVQVSGFFSARGNLNVVADLIPKPIIHTFFSQLLTPSAAKVSAEISTAELPSTLTIQYGLTTNYGMTQVRSNVLTSSPELVETILAGLVAGQTYHYRVAITNAGGGAVSADGTFTLGTLAGDLTSGYVVAWGENFYGQATVPTNLGRVKSVAGGLYHSIALLTNGTVAAWGLGAVNQTRVPSSATNVIAIAAGDQHNIALRDNGTVVAWGDNGFAQTNVPASATNVIAVSAGNNFSVALRADGTLVGWGSSGSIPPSTLSNLVAISCGGSHGLGLRADGTVVSWGIGTSGQTNIPVGLSNVIAIAAGGEIHSMALRNDGRVFVWGSSSFGQTTVPAAATNGIIAIAAGGDHCLALTTNGTLISWGRGTSGQTNTPRGIGNFLALAGGDDHNLAVVLTAPPVAFSQTVAGPMNSNLLIPLPAQEPDGGTLGYWIHKLPESGGLYQYNLGMPGAPILATNTPVNDPFGRVFFVPDAGTFGTPYAEFQFFVNYGGIDSELATITVKIHGAPYVFTATATSVTLSNAQLNAMVTAHRAGTKAWFEWGTDTGYGNQTAPFDVTNLTVVTAVKSAVEGLSPYTIYHARALASNDAGITYGADVQFGVGRGVAAWGFNGSGQLNVPATATNVVSLAAGFNHMLALRADGRPVGWGIGPVTNIPVAATNLAAIASGDNAGLGLRTNGSILVWNLAAPPTLSNVVAISSGNSHGVALREDGTVVAWGSSFIGQTNIPTGLSNVVAISAGGEHTLALKDDGTVVGWGINSSGQSLPPADLRDVVAIAAGGDVHSVALKRDGKVVGWGNNGFGQTNTPANLGTVAAIAAGGEHNLALQSDGAVASWGKGGNGQTNVPAHLTNVISIAGGDDFSAALTLNLPPVALAQGVSGGRNADLVITLNATDANSDPITLRVRSLPSVGTLYQYNAGVRGAAIVSVDTLVTDALGRVIFMPVNDTDGSPYASFEFVASDGAVESQSGLITIRIVGTPYATTLPAMPLGDLTAQLNGMATPNSQPTTAWFQWGTNSTYGNTTPAMNVGSGTSVVLVTNAVNLPTSASALHYRLVVSNSLGMAYGAEQRYGVAGIVRAWGINARGQTNVPAGLSNVVSITGGFDHTVALKNDGTLVVWGGNTSGQTNIPVAATNIVAVSGGDLHTLALRRDGIVLCWGNPNAINVPANLSNVVAISAGGAHNVALKSDGTMVAWGFNNNGQGSVPGGLSNVVWVSAGGDHNLALRNDGTVVSWGLNGNAQTNVPADLDKVVAVAGGGRFHSYALKQDGSIVAWGNNNSGQLNIPTDATNIIAIGPGGDHTLGLKSDGTAVAWGFNSFGQTNVPAALSTVTYVAGADNHSMALALTLNTAPVATNQNIAAPANSDVVITLTATDADGDPLTYRIPVPPAGRLYQFSGGGRGPLMTGTDILVTDPSRRVVLALSNTLISFDYSVSDGSRTAIGNIRVNPLGSPLAHTMPAVFTAPTNAQLRGMATANGHASSAWFEWGTTTNYGNVSLTTPVGSGSNVVYVTGEVSGLSRGVIYHYRLVVESAIERVYGADQLFGIASGLTAWGLNNLGQNNIPWDLTNAVSIAGGRDHNVAVTAGGLVRVWGGNSFGQTNLPAGYSNIVAVAAGDTHSLALRADGIVMNWGANPAQNNPPAGLSNVIAIAAGANHSVALRTDGRVVSWGFSTTALTNVAGSLSNIVAISAGGDHSLAIRSDGTVVGWGSNGSGQTNPPAGLGGVVAVSAGGDNHSLALTKTGSVIAWGNNSSGQSNLPPDLESVALIAAAGFHNLALERDGTVKAWGRDTSLQTMVPAGLTNVFALTGGDQHSLALSMNTSPTAAPQIVPSRPHRDVTITLTAADVNGDALTLRISAVPTGASLYQYNAGARGALIDTPGTLVTDSLGRVIAAVASEGTEFEFVANDGALDSAAARVEIVIAGKAFATTRPAHLASSGSLQLNGFATANLYPTLAWFEWGSSSALGLTTAPIDIGNGTNAVPVSVSLPAPATGFAYHFRLVASNELGVAYGGQQIFGAGRPLHWGLNQFGVANVPASLSNVVSVAGGANHSLALRADGTVTAWGDAAQTNMPPGMSNIIAISAGDAHSVALREDGRIFVWGSSNSGQYNVPIHLTNAVAISAGAGFTLAQRADGSVVGWGFNNNGETSVPFGLGNVVGFAAGGASSLALRNDGTVVAWAANGNGQTNVPAGLNHVGAVSAGRRIHGLALREDGSVAAWGNNIVNTVTVPPTLGSLIGISAGGDHSMGLKANRTVTAWGRNNVGQTNVPAGLSNVVSMAAALDFNLAVRMTPSTAAAAITLFASPVGLSTATLNGSAFPGSEPASVYFEWGTTTNYGNVTAPMMLAPGTETVSISQTIAGLSPASEYHFRLVAASPSGTNAGLDSVFVTTDAPAVPGNIGSAGINSNGLFQMGFSAHSNQAFTVLASTNLFEWTPVGSPTQPSPGTFQFIDLQSTNYPNRFYQLRTP